MSKKPRWMESVLRTVKEDLPPLPFARTDLRHDARDAAEPAPTQ